MKRILMMLFIFIFAVKDFGVEKTVAQITCNANAMLKLSAVVCTSIKG